MLPWPQHTRLYSLHYHLKNFPILAAHLQSRKAAELTSRRMLPWPQHTRFYTATLPL